MDAALEEAMLTGLLAMQSDINLQAYGITSKELGVAMANIVYSTPELFYLSASYSYSSDDGGHIVMLRPSYRCTADEVAKMRAEYDAALAEIVANAPTTGSDFEKILYLHDYFVRNYTYDKTLTIRDVHTFFTKKTGVCQAYMLGLIAAAEALGLESLPVTSDEMRHAWNLVKVDNSWYHVDVTWDDTDSLPTRMSYRYFLQSDTGLAAIDAGNSTSDRHYAWTSALPATNPKYDAALFRDANTGIVTYGDKYYVAVKDDAVTDNTVRGTIYYGTDPTALEKFSDITGGMFAAGVGKYYTDCFSDLMLGGSVLYYHSGNSVGYVDLSAQRPQYRVVFADGLTTGESIYGFLGKTDNILTVVVATAPNADTYRTLEISIP